MLTTLLDRPRPSPPPLDWLTLTDAFEIACMVRCTPPPAADVRRLDSGPHRGGIAEFNREDAAQRMRQLLGRLDVPVEHELTTGGLRRRYELHRLSVPPPHRAAYANLLTAGWRLGGTVGVGTVVYAFGIGPLVQLFVRLTPRRLLAASGWAPVDTAQRDTGAPAALPAGSVSPADEADTGCLR